MKATWSAFWVLACGVPVVAQGADGGEAALSPAAQVSRAQGLVEGVRKTLAFAVEQRDQAQNAKDVIRINCVADKLAGIKGLLKIAEQSQVGATEASQAGNQELLDHHFTKISIASMQVENFRIEVEGCMGEASRYTGDTVVTLTIDDDVRSDNPAVEPDVDVFPPVAFERPEAISGSE